ncbi:hypothetical protein [uncultured Paraglaciecola sp.]|uniref:hypothetical protein n=1 Tax=uncultured Paraglaciecola sp. TaxID=1765024 RepID=UPI00259A06A9|nr:hypothetical protein [uncultured Paraglaciecola sp.]
MNNQIDTTQFTTQINGKPTVGFCIDDDGRSWINIKILSPTINLIHAAFDGVPFITIKATIFVCADWAKTELFEVFQNDAQTTQIISNFFQAIELEKQKVLGVYNGKH